MVSHLKQRPGFTEHKVSHVELRPNSHRRKGVESKVSQRVQHYEQRQGLREGRASQKAKPHRSQGPTEGKTSQRVWPTKQRQGLTEGRGVPSLVWLQACVSHMAMQGFTQ